MENAPKIFVESFTALIREIVADEIRRALAEQTTKRAPLLVDTAGAAALMELPESWVAAAARRGELASVRFGHHVRFKISDLQQFIETSCVKTNGAASPATAKQGSRKSSAGLANGVVAVSANGAVP